MQKFIIALALFSAVGLGIVGADGSKNINGKSVPVVSVSPTITAPTVNPIAEPAMIRIPKIGVSAQVESVGEDSKGRMDVPQNPMDVGWYNMGFKPGENGSAVLDGHLDLATGAPAIFWNLSKLEVGDIIIITDENKKDYTFTVIGNKVYDYNNAPLNEIFAPAYIPKLNLITCNGVWDRQTHNYSKRTVVYAEMKN